MKMRRRALSVLLSLAVIFTFMPFVSSQAFAASSKQPLVTKAVDNDGDTTTYTYNKKGLVKKSVTKSSYSGRSYDGDYDYGDDRDVKSTVTTTYKYTKKNKISSATTTDTDSKTYYRTDNTTGKKRVANKGTVKDTYKTVTKFKYNKKGLATQSVATTTLTKSGSTTNISSSLNLPGVKKLNDGSYMYYENGYWDDDDYIHGTQKVITAAEAAALAKSYTGTTAYKDNGNGTYTVSSASTNPDAYISDPTTYKEQTVVTTNYKYKKKNVKSETRSKVYTTEESWTDKYGTAYKTSVVKTYSPETVSYTYKKGRVSKQVTTDPGTWTSVRTATETLTNGDVYVTTTTSDAYGNRTEVTTKNGVPTGDPEKTTGKNHVYPTKDTVNYKYDKNGNLKANNGNKTDTDDTETIDEVYYSSYIYVIVSANDPESVMTPVSTVEGWKTTLQNTVKNGTKKLTEVLRMTKSTKDGRAVGKKGSYSMSRTKFTLKNKPVNSKASANVEAQQWMIQNNVFSVAGLW